MYLCRLEIGNFRGIRSARLDFGENTVLTGENNSGKSTLLEAIYMVLAPQPADRPIIFNASDFFMENGPEGYKAAGPVNIRLTFRERQADEWSYMRNNELGLELNDDTRALQELSLEVRANPVSGSSASVARWRINVEGRSQFDFCEDTGILAWIRRLNPVFRIKSGVFTILPKEEETSSDKRGGIELPQDAEMHLESRIRQYYKNLVEGTTINGDEDLQAGYRAALRFLGRVAGRFFQDGPPVEDIIYEILGKKPADPEQSEKRITLRHGSTAEQIGLLLFATAFLQSGGLTADPSAEPILIIEDPEAHLHPMTLESVKLLIERLIWQKIITTQSGSLLSGFPLEDIRRIARHEGYIRQHWVKPGNLSSEELRRLSYHVRMRRTTATFARAWLLVEGESEVWLLPHLARLCGYDLTLEGVVCVEFAQCGIAPLIKAARLLGIQWYLMADGDAAGKAYIETAKHFARLYGNEPHDHCMRLKERDIENHLFSNGYSEVYREYSGIPPHTSQNMPPGRIINRAIHRNSKPFMAVAVVEAIARKDSPGVPPQLRQVIEKSIRLAKEAR